MTLGFGIASSLGVEVGRAAAAEAERLGYDAFWVTDGLSAAGLPLLAAAQEATRHIRLGVGVIPVDARPAEEIERSVRELGIDLGRLVLGVGSGRAEHRLAAVRSAVGELRSGLGAGAAIAVAGLGPRMLRLAGEIADVAQPNWMDPGRIEWARRHVAEGERRAGRPAGTVRIAMYVRVALGDGAAERLAAEAGRYARGSNYAGHFAAMGVEPGAVGIAARSAEEIPPALEPYERVLDETIVRALPAADDAESVIAIARAGRGVRTSG